MSAWQDSRDKAVSDALMLWAFAELAGDRARVDVARAILREVGYPGGEGALPLAEAVARADSADRS